MRPVPAGVPLTEPLRAAGFVAGGVEPQGPGGGDELLAVDDPSGQADLRLAGRLIKITVKGGFESARALENHLRDRRDVDEIQAFRPDPVHSDVSDQKHAKDALSFGLGAHQAGEQLDFFFVMPDYRH